MLIRIRMSLTMARQVTALLAGTCAHIIVAIIGRSRSHDRRVEVDHCPIGARSSPDNAVRIMTSSAAIAPVITMRRTEAGQVVALIA